MTIFKKDPLIGSWLNESSELEKIRMDFTEDGQLTYTIIYPDKTQKIFLTYWTNGGILYTDQPSSPKEEKTTYVITQNGEELILIYADELPMHFFKLNYNGRKI